MAQYKVTLRVEIDRYVEANSKEEAVFNVDRESMIHELKRYKVDEQWVVEEEIDE